MTVADVVLKFMEEVRTLVRTLYTYYMLHQFIFSYLKIIILYVKCNCKFQISLRKILKCITMPDIYFMVRGYEMHYLSDTLFGLGSEGLSRVFHVILILFSDQKFNIPSLMDIVTMKTIKK